jgi:endonuclease VIII
MPEGHTLHRLAALHRRRYVGRPVAVSSPQGRFVTSAELVDGRVLESVEAYGKHLFHTYGYPKA